MFKKYKKNIIAAGIVTLLPMLAGLALWNRLPEQVATHFDAAGMPDGYSSRLMAAVGIPAIMLAVFAVCILVTMADPKFRNINGKTFVLVIWLVPLLSVFAEGMILVNACGIAVSPDTASKGVIGLLFLIIGNYLPKVRQNYTVGIKLPWTLASEDNWNKTHRLAGKLWVIGGLVLIADIFLKFMGTYGIFFLVIVATMIPTGYSYLHYRKYGADSKDDDASDIG